MVNESRIMSNRFNRNPHVTFSSTLCTTTNVPLSSKSTNSFANNIHLSVFSQKTSSICSVGNFGPDKRTKVSVIIENDVSSSQGTVRAPEYPIKSANDFIWRKIEAIIEKMQSEDSGVPIRTVKSLMSTVPSVFTGSDVVTWVMKHLKIEDVNEAVHVASMASSMGYLFPIADHQLVVKNDAHSFYRFQTPCLYPSRCCEVDNIEYAVYLCKRTMQNKQRLELADFEAERLATLQSFYWHKWEFIYLQAEAEAKVDKKRDKVERLVLESQEKGFWDTNRPVTGAANNNDIDMRKLCRSKRPKKVIVRPSFFPIYTGSGGSVLWHSIDGSSLLDKVTKMKAFLEKKRIRVIKAFENMESYRDQYNEFDMLLVGGSNSFGILSSITSSTSPANTGNNVLISSMAGQINQSVVSLNNGGQSSSTNQGAISNTEGNTAANGNDNSNGPVNPWVCDNIDFWTNDLNTKDLSLRRVKRWGFSIHELLKDPAGREEIQKWLEKEFSAENLKFWEQCQELKAAPLRDLSRRIDEIYQQFLASNAVEPLNVDSKVAENVRNRVTRSSGANPDRYCFEEAEEHIFKLMTSDSYYRYLRSNIYKELTSGQKKKSKRRFPADIRQRLEIE